MDLCQLGERTDTTGHYRLPSNRRVPRLLPTSPAGTLSDRLRKIRRCHGLTSRQTARLADVNHETFLKWERGLWTPTVLTRERLDQFLERFERDLKSDCPATGR
jgi:DNA-binding XRE family transcriptional regulator